MFNKNPVISEEVLERYQTINSQPMTVQGSIIKTAILLIIMMIPAFVTWYQFFLGYLDKVQFMITAGSIIGLISALIIIFKANTSPYIAPIYAFAEGTTLGALSAFFEKIYPGIAIQAISCTMMVAFSSLILYKSGLIKVTEKFRSILFMALSSIFLIYLISFIMNFFNKEIPYLFGSNPIGIAFSILVVIVAALSLFINFDFIEKGSENFLPKYMEWYAGFSFLMTIIWLYVEILKLLAKIYDRKE